MRDSPKRTVSNDGYKGWLVVWTPLKNISQLGWLFPIYGKIKNGNQTTNQRVINPHFRKPDWSTRSLQNCDHTSLEHPSASWILNLKLIVGDTPMLGMMNIIASSYTYTTYTFPLRLNTPSSLGLFGKFWKDGKYQNGIMVAPIMLPSKLPYLGGISHFETQMSHWKICLSHLTKYSFNTDSHSYGLVHSPQPHNNQALK